MRGLISCATALLLLLTACGDDKNTNPGDSTAPGRITDLTITNSVDDEVSLSWTAPGDDGGNGTASEYDIRYAANVLTEETWTSATRVVAAPDPEAAGQTQSVTVSGLAHGTWHFGMKTADEVPNWSALSNVVTVTVVDDTPPSRITDLSVESTTAGGMTLTWTAPGDDGESGRATQYDVRYSRDGITDETWDDATPAPKGLPQPSSAGLTQSFTVTGLEFHATYHFAIKTADEVPNWSPLSNVLEAATANVLQLTTNPTGAGIAANPSWSPDGEQIVFSAGWEGNRDLYTMPSAGGEPLRITDDPAYDDFPEWSPLGDRIAFVSDRGGDREIWMVDTKGASEPSLVVGHAGEDIHWLTWSPDGTRIAYQVPFGGTGVSPTDIYVIPLDGGHPEVLIEGGDDWGNWHPAWSPDGERMAIMSTRALSWDIYVVPLAGGEWIRLTRLFSFIQSHSPTWSPDGTQIAYASQRSNFDFDIHRIPAEGGENERLTFDPGWDTAPAWSPKGDTIAFASDRSGVFEIWLLAVD